MKNADVTLQYREAAVRGSSPVALVITLYDVLLDDIRRAVEALRAGDVERRTREIQHGLEVVGHLQGTLDMERGGEPARNLDRLYSIVRGKLMEAHWKASEELLVQQAALLRPIREAWQEAERLLSQPEPVPAETPHAAVVSQLGGESLSTGGWSA